MTTADRLILSVYRACLADHGNTQAACTETAERCGVDRAAVWAALYRARVPESPAWVEGEVWQAIEDVA